MNWSHREIELVARLLSARTGLDFVADRRPAVETGIRRAMTRAGIADLASYSARIDREPALFDDLIVELTVGETYFFREPDQFRFLRDVVLPELRGRRGPDHLIRVWSAGCASGEEAYSLAMLLADAGLSDRAHLIATDISRAALVKARAGRYTSWSLRGEGAAAALPHLRSEDGRYVVTEAIRHRVAFESLNLATDVYPSHATGTWGSDLILCRNVLIYFDHETVGAVARRLFASLAAGGWLITASSDPPLATEAPFALVTTDLGVFYQRPAEETGAGDEALKPYSSQNGDESGSAGLLPSLSVEPSIPMAQREPRPPVAEETAGEAGSLLDAARDDLARGHYARVADQAGSLAGTADGVALLIRALANLDPAEAERAAAEGTGRHPLSSELHYLRAVLLLGLERVDEAARAARKALYLDRTLAIAHFLLGSVLRRRGDRAGAWRSYRNARDLCAAQPPDADVPLSDGESAGRLAELARLQMAHLELPREERT